MAISDDALERKDGRGRERRGKHDGLTPDFEQLALQLPDHRVLRRERFHALPKECSTFVARRLPALGDVAFVHAQALTAGGDAVVGHEKSERDGFVQRSPRPFDAPPHKVREHVIAVVERQCESFIVEQAK